LALRKKVIFALNNELLIWTSYSQAALQSKINTTSKATRHGRAY
jgi:hypothetical protein